MHGTRESSSGLVTRRGRAGCARTSPVPIRRRRQCRRRSRPGWRPHGSRRCLASQPHVKMTNRSDRPKCSIVRCTIRCPVSLQVFRPWRSRRPTLTGSSTCRCLPASNSSFGRRVCARARGWPVTWPAAWLNSGTVPNHASAHCRRISASALPTGTSGLSTSSTRASFCSSSGGTTQRQGSAAYRPNTSGHWSSEADSFSTSSRPPTSCRPIPRS